MKILILYFSGTGNTKFIGDRIAEQLESREYDFDLKAVENFSPKNLSEYDFLVFGFPVYVHDLPHFLKDFIAELSLTKSRGVILYATAGKNSGNALRKTGNLFKKNDFIPLFTAEFIMPANDFILAESKKSKKVKRLIASDFKELAGLNKVAEKIAEKAIENAEKNLNKDQINLPRRKFTSSLIDPTMQFLFKLIKKFLISKFRADENCTLCGYCEKICPADNIVIENEEVKFLDKCYLCLRCVNHCPEEAIQISRLTKNKFRYKGPNSKYEPQILNDNKD